MKTCWSSGPPPLPLSETFLEERGNEFDGKAHHIRVRSLDDTDDRAPLLNRIGSGLIQRIHLLQIISNLFFRKTLENYLGPGITGEGRAGSRIKNCDARVNPVGMLGKGDKHPEGLSLGSRLPENSAPAIDKGVGTKN